MQNDRSRSRPAVGPRRGGMRPVAAALPKIAAKAIGRRGFAEASLITDWTAIVGNDLAAVSQPDRLSFPPGRRADGVLHIRVGGGVATELQHLEPLVIERINSHFGYGAVARLKLIHAPLVGRAPPAAPRTGRETTLDPGRRAALERVLAAVDDPEMRTALERLGSGIMRRDSRAKRP